MRPFFMPAVYARPLSYAMALRARPRPYARPLSCPPYHARPLCYHARVLCPHARPLAIVPNHQRPYNDRHCMIFHKAIYP